MADDKYKDQKIKGSDDKEITKFSTKDDEGNNLDSDNDVNCFVANTGCEVVPAFNFMLRVEGLIDVPCKSVRAFTKENEFEFIKEGGLNDYVHLKRKPISKPFTLVVERYAAVDYVDPLPLGEEITAPLILMISNYQNDFFPARRTYTFMGCTVMSKEYGALDAEKGGLLTETITIAYRQMLKVDIPDAAVRKDPYKVSDNTPIDSRTGKSAIVNTAEVRKKDMSSTTYAYRYKIGDEKKDGFTGRALKAVPVKIKDEKGNEIKAVSYKSQYIKQKEDGQRELVGEERHATYPENTNPNPYAAQYFPDAPKEGEKAKESVQRHAKNRTEGKDDNAFKAKYEITGGGQQRATQQKSTGKPKKAKYSIKLNKTKNVRAAVGPDTGKAEIRQWIPAE